MEADDVMSSAIESRIEDLHEAFADKNVKAIFTVIGGFNSNQLLSHIDYELIKNNPKILCGFSDITALTNAIYAKTGVTMYSGPHYSSFGMKKGFEYTLDYFKKMFMEDGEIEIKSSKEWSNDPWFMDQVNRNFIKNEGMFVINEGEAEGKIIGGNLCTFNLLQGTEYMPDLTDAILFIEDDGLADKFFYVEFDRNLQSLIHQKNFDKVRGIVIGREENNTNMTKEKWINLIRSKVELNNIPVIAGADFGHTTPIFTFPIGGKAKLVAKDEKIELVIR
jgi:muramoyltetrapeptide carboxypeptidase LdcA involved in peptidoglycan recycling